MRESVRVWFGPRPWAVAGVIWLCSFLWSLTVLAGPTGTITGVVRDSGGAFISGAEVSATNLATNFTRTAITNASGRYVIAELLPGDYRLEVKRDGFQTAVETRVVVNVEAIVAKDFTLVAGAISETITVESDSDLVNRESGAVGTVIERKFVENLPLNGRSFQALIELTPGVVLATPSIFDRAVQHQRTAYQRQLLHGGWRQRQFRGGRHRAVLPAGRRDAAGADDSGKHQQPRPGRRHAGIPRPDLQLCR